MGDDYVLKTQLAQAILKQMDVTSALLDLIYADKTDLAAISEGRKAYFAAQRVLLAHCRELLA